MKKANIIIIAVIYLSSIVLISFFGMQISVLEPIVPVTGVLCLNESDNNCDVYDNEDYTYIRIKFTTAGDIETLSGTMLQLEWRVLPDNATTSNVKFVYTESERVTFVTDGSGDELGLLLFSGVVLFNVKIMATDGSKLYASVVISVY